MMGADGQRAFDVMDFLDGMEKLQNDNGMAGGMNGNRIFEMADDEGNDYQGPTR